MRNFFRMFIGLCVVISIYCILFPKKITHAAAAAATVPASNASNAAEVLNSLGLFSGSAGGYDLNRKPTRAEGLVMLIRLTGAEEKAKAIKEEQPDCPFTDIAGKWCEPYVRYAYANKLIGGMGNNLFAPNRAMSLNEYAAMLLRALKYEFLYDNAAETAKNVGLFNYCAVPAKSFTRGDMALMSYSALFCDNIETGESLLQALLHGKIISSDKIREADFTAVKLVHAANSYDADDTAFSINKKKFKTGMNLSEITKILGAANRTDVSPYGFSWHVYNGDYSAFVMVGINAKNKAVAFYSNSDGAAYRGVEVGKICPPYSDPDGSVLTVFTDTLDGNKVDGLLVLPRNAAAVQTVTYEMTSAAERQLMDMANAERVSRGLNAFEWSDAAAKTAKMHSLDMSKKKYFSHTSPDGKSSADRMKTAGISFAECAENIAQGYSTAFPTHHAWINSEGHRKNLLDETLTRFGAGVTKDNYYTQNFFAN